MTQLSDVHAVSPRPLCALVLFGLLLAAGCRDTAPKRTDTVSVSSALKWGTTNPVKRKCKKNSGQPCSATESIVVEIEPMEGVDGVDHENMTEPLVVMARMRNTGDFEESLYGMPPHSEYWYITWIADANKHARMQIMRTVKDAAGNTVLELDPKQYPVKLCPDDHGKPSKSEAGFTDCLSTGFVADSSQGRSAPKSDTGPAWLTCSQGCCTAEYAR
jgi:hypothetical protein